MAQHDASTLAQLVAEHEDEILGEWLELQKNAGVLGTGRMSEPELRTACRNFLGLLRAALTQASDDASDAAYGPVRDMLGDLSRSRAAQGFSAIETMAFVFSLKPPLFNALGRTMDRDIATIVQSLWAITRLLDQLGLDMVEVFQASREQTIIRQQREIAELSTPVVKLWDGVLALPVIGTLDSQRTQVVMENLLEAIVAQGAEIAIIDITGVPTVDTLTAQHLLKTVSAARLMGADCIISGIRPQIAQTLVHLGVELNMVTKSTLADAFAVALRRVGRAVVAVKRTSRGQAEMRE
jgi:rsbT co-antagonist protein RsbR